MKNLILPFVVTGSMLAAVFNNTPADKKTKTLPDNSKLTYNVDDKNNLSGAYLVENPQKSVTLRGVYTENKRTGNWYCFNNNQTMFMRYNYDAKKVLFIDTVALKKAEITITDKDPEALKNASVPLPIFSIDQMVSLLGESAKAGYPKDLVVYNQPIDINIVATIKSKNDVSYRATYMYNNKVYAFALKTAAIPVDIEWIPSMYNGKEIEAEFKIPTKITFDPESDKQRFIWNY